MPTIAGISIISKRQQRETIEAIKRRSFNRQVDHIVENGLMASALPLAERVHNLLLANRPGSKTELPAPVKVEAQPLFDLIISTRRVAKFGGHTQSNDGKILWIKRAGCDKQLPQQIHRLSDSDILAKLDRYQLIDQVATSTEIWHRYTLKGE